jgi:hypothetical protein
VATARLNKGACPLWIDAVENGLSKLLERNNRIRTAIRLNRNCVRGSDFESMLRDRTRKIVFQQYRLVATEPFSALAVQCPWLPQ